LSDTARYVLPALIWRRTTSDEDSSRRTLSNPCSSVRPARDGVKRTTDLPAPRMLSVPPPHGGCTDAPAPSRERSACRRIVPLPAGSPGLLEHVRLVTLRQLFENVGMDVHGCLHVAGPSVRPSTQAVCAFCHTTRVIYGTPGWALAHRPRQARPAAWRHPAFLTTRIRQYRAGRLRGWTRPTSWPRSRAWMCPVGSGSEKGGPWWRSPAIAVALAGVVEGPIQALRAHAPGVHLSTGK
jgi:hypothetical protein